MISTFEFQLLMALLLDLLLGDPRWLPHPVRGIGVICQICEHHFRLVCSSEKVGGLLTVLMVLFITVGFSAFVLAVVHKVSPLSAQFLAVIILYTAIALKDLLHHARTVYDILTLHKDIPLEVARKAVAMIVGRDTSALERKGIIKATVETVAENMVDGVTAPLFYAIVSTFFSPVTGIHPIYLAACGAMGYKAINTMDSMIAYKNERYLYFGWTAAIVDDIANFIPARLSGIALILSAWLLKDNWKNSYEIFKKDRLAHSSPNAAHTEAAVAGALDVQLGGKAVYFGKVVEKPSIGTENQEISEAHILQANHLVVVGSLLFIVFMLIVRAAFCLFFS